MTMPDATAAGPAAGRPSLRASLVELVRLALPAVVVQVGMMAMGVVDTLMVGHVSPGALAAVALGNLYFFAQATFGMGTLMALDPIVAQAVGAHDTPAISRGIKRGLLIAALLTVPGSLFLLPVRPLLELLGQPADVVPGAAAYTLVSIPGVFPTLAFIVLRQALQAMGRMAPIVWVIVLANLVNVFLNWCLIFGHLGAPPLGVTGAALATVVSRWFMAGALLVAGWRDLREPLRERHPEVWDRAPILRMVRLGAPIGAQYFLEYGIFGLVGLLMGLLGTRELAGHQVALNLASLTFMVPLGVSTAGAVLVGQAVGRGDAGAARRAAVLSYVLGVGFMLLSALVFLLVPATLAGFYTRDAAVIAVAATLIPLAGLFQVFDGMQVVGSGVLRGLGDTRAPMLVNLLGFWLLGLPVSIGLGFRTGLGPRGLWWGLVVGLGAVAAILVLRVRRRFSRELRRVVIDHHPHPAGGA